MGLDAWGVKLKEGVDYKSAWWEDIDVEATEKSIIPINNCFNERVTFDGKHYDFIKKVVPRHEMMGNPCCSRESLQHVCIELNSWLREHKEEDYIVDETTIIESQEISDLIQYLNILNDNGFVLWMSW